MSLNAYIEEARDFMDKAGFKNEDVDRLIKILEDEFNILKSSKDDFAAIQHQVYDMLFLLFEIAAKYNMDLDSQWIKGRVRKKKYFKTDNKK